MDNPAPAGEEVKLTGRKLAYAFLMLPYHVRLKILNELGLPCEEVDEQDEMNLFINAFGVARDKGLLDQLAAKAAEQTARLRPASPPPSAPQVSSQVPAAPRNEADSSVGDVGVTTEYLEKSHGPLPVEDHAASDRRLSGSAHCHTQAGLGSETAPTADGLAPQEANVGGGDFAPRHLNHGLKFHVDERVTGNRKVGSEAPTSNSVAPPSARPAEQSGSILGLSDAGLVDLPFARVRPEFSWERAYRELSAYLHRRDEHNQYIERCDSLFCNPIGAPRRQSAPPSSSLGEEMTEQENAKCYEPKAASAPDAGQPTAMHWSQEELAEFARLTSSPQREPSAALIRAMKSAPSATASAAQPEASLACDELDELLARKGLGQLPNLLMQDFQKLLTRRFDSYAAEQTRQLREELAKEQSRRKESDEQWDSWKAEADKQRVAKVYAEQRAQAAEAERDKLHAENVKFVKDICRLAKQRDKAEAGLERLRKEAK